MLQGKLNAHQGKTPQTTAYPAPIPSHLRTTQPASTSSGTSKINFYIGYDESLTADMENFSLCSVQPSAEMTALLLSEQTYRAYTILNNITYHK